MTLSCGINIQSLVISSSIFHLGSFLNRSDLENSLEKFAMTCVGTSTRLILISPEHAGRSGACMAASENTF